MRSLIGPLRRSREAFQLGQQIATLFLQGFGEAAIWVIGGSVAKQEIEGGSFDAADAGEPPMGSDLSVSTSF
jgi:hypothetical protein